MSRSYKEEADNLYLLYYSVWRTELIICYVVRPGMVEITLDACSNKNLLIQISKVKSKVFVSSGLSYFSS